RPRHHGRRGGGPARDFHALKVPGRAFRSPDIPPREAGFAGTPAAPPSTGFAGYSPDFAVRLRGGETGLHNAWFGWAGLGYARSMYESGPPVLPAPPPPAPPGGPAPARALPGLLHAAAAASPGLVQVQQRPVGRAGRRCRRSLQVRRLQDLANAPAQLWVVLVRHRPMGCGWIGGDYPGPPDGS